MPMPASYDWLCKNPKTILPYQHFLAALDDYREFLIGEGVQPNDIFTNEEYVSTEDYERFVHVVSKWPEKAKGKYSAPTCSGMVLSIKHMTPRQTFAQKLDMKLLFLQSWAKTRNIDLENPESENERRARLNRERVAKHRLANTVGGEPTLIGMASQLRDAKASLHAGRAWIRLEEARLKMECEAKVSELRRLKNEKIAENKAHLARAEELVEIITKQIEQATSTKQ